MLRLRAFAVRVLLFHVLDHCCFASAFIGLMRADFSGLCLKRRPIVGSVAAFFGFFICSFIPFYFCMARYPCYFDLKLRVLLHCLVCYVEEFLNNRLSGLLSRFLDSPDGRLTVSKDVPGCMLGAFLC